MTNRWIRLAAALVLASTGTAGADTVDFGTRLLEIAPPEGYVPAKARMWVAFEENAALYPPGQARLVEMYVTDAALKAAQRDPSFRPDRLLHLEGTPALDGKRIDDDGFARMRPAIATMLRAMPGELAPGQDGTALLRLDDALSWGLSYSTTTRETRGGKPVSIVMSSVITCVDRQLLTLHAISRNPVDVDAALAWSAPAVADWAQALRTQYRMNDASPCGAPERRSWFRGRNLDRITIGICLFATLVAGIRWWRARRR